MCKHGSTAASRDRRCKEELTFRRATSALSLHSRTMEALAKQQKVVVSIKERLDYRALAPAAAALCYPFLLRAFHALVGPPDVTPPTTAILGAALILTVAFSVPFLGTALALRPAASAGARRLAYASVAAPALYVFLGVVQALVRSPIPDEIVWGVIWLA